MHQVIQSTDKPVGKNVFMSLQAHYDKRTTRQWETFHLLVKAMPILRRKLDLPNMLTFRIAGLKARNLNGRYWSEEQTVELNYRRHWNQSLLTLCHELVHAEQYHTGRLQFVKVNNSWKQAWHGRVWSKGTGHMSYDAYRSLPWEQEAFDRQDALAKEVLMELGE